MIAFSLCAAILGWVFYSFIAYTLELVKNWNFVLLSPIVEKAFDKKKEYDEKRKALKRERKMQKREQKQEQKRLRKEAKREAKMHR